MKRQLSFKGFKQWFGRAKGRARHHLKGMFASTSIIMSEVITLKPASGESGKHQIDPEYDRSVPKQKEILQSADQLYQVAHEIADAAYIGLRTNSGVESTYKEEMNSEVDAGERASLLPVEQKLNSKQAQLAAINIERASFNRDEKAKEIQDSEKFALMTEAEKMNTRLAEIGYARHEKEQVKKLAIERMFSSEKQLGTDLKKTWVEEYPNIIRGIMVSVDWVYCWGAFVDKGMEPVFAFLFATATSLTLFGGTERIGQAIQEGNHKEASVWAVAIIGMLVYVMAVRSSDPHLWLTAPGIALLSVVGILQAWYIAGRQRWFRNKSKVNKTDKQLEKLIGEEKSLRQSLENQKEMSWQDCLEKADQYKKDLDDQARKIEQSVTFLERELNTEKSHFKAIRRKCLAIVQRGIDKGNASRRNDDNNNNPFRNSAAAIALMMSSFLFSGCTEIIPKQHIEGAVILDCTIDEPEFTNTLFRTISVMSNLQSESRLDEEFYGIRSANIEVSTITRKSLGTSVSAHLPAASPILFRNVPEREKEIDNYLNRLESCVDSVLSVQITSPGSNVWRTTASTINKLMDRSGDRRFVVLMTDGLNLSKSVNLYRYKDDPLQLRRDSESVKRKYLNDTPITMRLNGLSVEILMESVPEREALAYEACLILKSLLEEHGADVTLMGNGILHI